MEGARTPREPSNPAESQGPTDQAPRFLMRTPTVLVLTPWLPGTLRICCQENSKKTLAGPCSRPPRAPAACPLCLVQSDHSGQQKTSVKVQCKHPAFPPHPSQNEWRLPYMSRSPESPLLCRTYLWESSCDVFSESGMHCWIQASRQGTEHQSSRCLLK